MKIAVSIIFENLDKVAISFVIPLIAILLINLLRKTLEIPSKVGIDILLFLICFNISIAFYHESFSKLIISDFKNNIRAIYLILMIFETFILILGLKVENKLLKKYRVEQINNFIDENELRISHITVNSKWRIFFQCFFCWFSVFTFMSVNIGLLIIKI